MSSASRRMRVARGFRQIRALRLHPEMASFVLLCLCRRRARRPCAMGDGPLPHLRAELLADQGLRRHRGRGARHDDHALLLLLAILAGSQKEGWILDARLDRTPEKAPARSLASASTPTWDGILQRHQPVHHRHHRRDPERAWHHRHPDLRQAAEALRPIAGVFTFALFAAGIIGIGLLAVPVLASGAYALGEALGWTTGLTEAARRQGFLRHDIQRST